MNIEQLEKGDMVFAASHIYNDGSIPHIPSDQLLAEPGARGVIVETGHLEDSPQRKVFLVRFEDAELRLGPATGCWAEELATSRDMPD